MEPLSRTKRIIYLVALIAVFIFVVPLLILYSVGYRWGDALSLVQTGGVFVHTEKSGSIILIDGKVAKNSNILNRSVLVQDLKPESHVVQVDRIGYTSWQKELMIYPEFVTEARVLMIPNQIFFEKKIDFLLGVGSTTATTLFATTSDQYTEVMTQFGLIEEATTTDETILDQVVDFITQEDLATTSTTTEEELEHHYAEYAEIFEMTIEEMQDVEFYEKRNHVYWIQNGNVHVVWIGRTGEAPFYFCEKDVCESKIGIDFENNIEKFKVFPGRDDVVFILENNRLMITELDNRSDRMILLVAGNEITKDFIIRDEVLYILREDGIYEAVDLIE